MKLTCKWQGGMKFTALAREHSTPMDAKAPIGSGSSLTPKELVIAGLCGCTAMDVAAFMRKQRQQMEDLSVDANVETTSGTPSLFANIELIFRAAGSIDKAVLLEAVQLSQTQHCGVSAMLAKAAPIHYRVELNGELIGTGKAEFSI